MNKTVFLVTVALALGACGGGGGGGADDGHGGPAANVAGIWSSSEQIDARQCGEGQYGDVETYTIAQNGNALTITSASGGSYNGSINGNTLNWSGSYPEDGGVVSITLQVQVAGDGNSMSGQASWTWSGQGDSCSGTAQLTALRQSSGGDGGSGDKTPLMHLSNLSGATDSENEYDFNVSNGTPQLSVRTSGGSGDADLYVFGPDNSYCESFNDGNAELCTVNNPKPGQWTAVLHGYSAYSGLDLVAESGPSTGGGAVNLTGSWAVSEQVNATQCGEGTYSDSYAVAITQNGSSLSVTADGATYTGSINGNSFNWSGSFGEDGGTTSVNLSGSVAANGNSLSGSSNWTWSNGSESCGGTTTFSASRSGQSGGGNAPPPVSGGLQVSDVTTPTTSIPSNPPSKTCTNRDEAIESVAINTPVANSDTTVTSLTFLTEMYRFFGEPMRKGTLKWQGTGSFYQILWAAEVLNEAGTAQFVNAAGQRVFASWGLGSWGGPGEDYGWDVTGSPSWAETFVVYNQSTNRFEYGVSAEEAQNIFSSCFVWTNFRVLGLDDEDVAKLRF